MKIRSSLLTFLFLLVAPILHAANDYENDSTYQSLHKTMHYAFNEADSARFFPALKNLEDYLLKQNDLHGYYTQRCNEIVFLMNQEKIFEAYKRARELSQELRKKKIHKEMYMAVNMLGHINRYCGNQEAAIEDWEQALEMMRREGYYANMPPIYMNIVNVVDGISPEKADSLLEIGKAIAEQYAPERVFDIETRRAVSYYNRGDMERFWEGYKQYKEGEKEGKSSVHGRSMEVYYVASKGETEKAVQMAREELGDEGLATITQIYKNAGRWKDAYEALEKERALSDSVNNIVLTNSMMGIRDEMVIYEAQQKAYRTRVILLSAIILLLLLLTGAFAYIMQARRRHIRQLRQAYQHALESDKMKTDFIQNISHEIRTPLNIINGFTQVISDPELASNIDLKMMSKTMQKNTRLITSLIDEMLELSLSENTNEVKKENIVEIDELVRDFLQECESTLGSEVTLQCNSSLPEKYIFKTNEDMLKRIISALVDNAVKNTTEGSITIYTRQPDDNHITLTVEDTGCGIPAAEAEHIFERFVKLDSFKEGLGLGLPLCRTLTTKLGGEIHLDTSYTEGARFIVTLPII